MTSSPTASLRLDEDDASEMLREIERSFDFKATDAEIAALFTFGDLEALVDRHAGPVDGVKCATSMTFYRIRRALVPYGVPVRAGPDLNLAGFALPPPKELARTLAKELDLESPPIVVSGSAFVSAGAIACCIVAMSLLTSAGSSLLVTLPLALIPLLLDTGAWVGDWHTLGTLSKAVAARNFAALGHAGARNNGRQRQLALFTIVRGWTVGNERIESETRLL